MPNKDVNVETVLKRIISKSSHRSNITLTPTCTFKDLGINSLEVVTILVSLEDTLGIELEDKDLESIKNMGEFINYIKEKVDQTA